MCEIMIERVDLDSSRLESLRNRGDNTCCTYLNGSRQEKLFRLKKSMFETKGLVVQTKFCVDIENISFASDVIIEAN